MSKIFILATVLLCSIQVVFAQTYTQYLNLKWEEKPRQLQLNTKSNLDYWYFEGAVYDEQKAQLPVYTWQTALNSHSQIQARLINPEYTPLQTQTALEHIGTDIELISEVVYERKRPVALVRLVPIRKNPSTGQYEKLVKAEIRLTAKAIPAPHALGKARGGNFTTTSKLTDGSIYKIAIDETGVYKLDYDFLKDAGFDVDNINPRNIQILGNGGKAVAEIIQDFRFDDLTENAITVVGEQDGSFDEGDYILFYGVGTNVVSYNSASKIFTHFKNPYTAKSHYFIKVANTAGKRIASVPSLTSTSYFSAQYDEVLHHEEQSINLMEEEFALPPSGRQWFGESFQTTKSRNFSFRFRDRIDTLPLNIQLRMATRAFSSSTINSTINGNNYFSSFIGASNTYIYSSFAQFLNRNDKVTATGNTININLQYSNSSTSANSWLDYITIQARCKLIFPGGQFRFRDASIGNQANATYQLSNAGSATIWDVSRPNKIHQHEHLNGVFGATIDTTLHEFIAFDDNSFLTPEAVGNVSNQNLHGITSYPDLIIVYHRNFESAAKKLANHRRSFSNMTVELVEIEQVYNEFSSGNADVTAIRDFSKMLYDRALAANANELKYLLLFGAGSFDYQAFGAARTVENNPNYIPVYQTVESNDPLSTYTSDDYFAMLDDNEGSITANNLLDIGVGRLPFRTGEEADIVVDKIIRYDSSPSTLGDWRNRLSFVADDEDNNLHLNDAESIAVEISGRDTSYNISKIYVDAFRQVSTNGGYRYPDAQNAILDDLFKGSLAINYLGHGGAGGWAGERIFTSSDINALKNEDNLPLFITATCSFGPHDDPSSVSAGELLLLNPGGGAIALLTTVRVVVASSNKVLARSTFREMFKPVNGKMPALGDVIRLAKNNSGLLSATNSRKYALLGDPSMTLAYPKYNVKTLSVNSQAISGKDTIKALQKVTITGQLEDQSGTLLSEFNGLITPTVYDKADAINTRANDAGSYVKTFDVQKKIIFKGNASVTNGKFEFSFIVPKDINYNIGHGRISYYAHDGTSEDANGNYDGVVIGGTNQGAVQDNKGPEVLVFMNNEHFAPGGITDANPKLFVKLYDENGINTVGNSIGHDLVSTLKNPSALQNEYILNDFYESEKDDYTRGTAIYPLKNLEEGLHNIHVKAWDVYNNPGEGETEFLVTNSAEVALKHVLNYPNPFTDKTSFQFEHNYPAQDIEVRVQIFTVSGRLVKTINRDLSAEENLGYRITDITWDGSDEFGERIGRGVYIYKVHIQALGTNDKSQQASDFQKLVILK
ncbi:MAG: type IX secretion system sortase PorU [Aureispira sp.]|nr:type IX secretion system sortase PorU [Aureispira sp.]